MVRRKPEYKFGIVIMNTTPHTHTVPGTGQPGGGGATPCKVKGSNPDQKLFLHIFLIVFSNCHLIKDSNLNQKPLLLSKVCSQESLYTVTTCTCTYIYMYNVCIIHVYIRTCRYIHVHVCICMYHTCTCMIHTCTCMILIHTCICMYHTCTCMIHTYMYMYTYVSYTYMYMYVSVCTYMIHVYTCTYVHTRTCMLHTCIYMYMYIYMYVILLQHKSGGWDLRIHVHVRKNSKICVFNVSIVKFQPPKIFPLYTVKMCNM